MRHNLRIFTILALLMTLIISSCGIVNKKTATMEPSIPAEPEILSPTSQISEANPTPEHEPTPDFFQIYREKLDYFYNILSNGVEDWEYGKGEVGLMEIADYKAGDEALASVGYTIQDLSGDGIPELLIMNVSNPGSSPAKGSSILALFSSSDGTPTLTFEGWSRNQYTFYERDKIYNTGSNGASNQVYIINQLSLDGKSLECLNYYITQPKENDPQTEGFFQDSECGQCQNRYDELDINHASFMRLLKEQLGNPREFELTAFSDYTPSQSANEQTTSAVKIQWADEALANYSSYDTFIADESEHQVKLLISSTQPLRDFNFLKLSIDGVDEAGNLITSTELIYNVDSLMPDYPLVVAMTFYGDLPSYGISYEDENGETRYFYITLSGKDGSLLLVEFNTP